MDSNQIESLANAWIAMHLAPQDSEEYHRNFWAYDQLSELCHDDPDSCWVVIKAIRRLDSSDLILSNVAAGPLEDFLVVHGKSYIGRLEAEASTDPQLCELLAAVWKNDIEDAVWERVARLAGKPW